jgi:hypothetical protein
VIALAYIAGLVAIGIMAANPRVRFGWVLVLLVALMAFRLTQPVTLINGTDYLGKTTTQEGLH